jgi:hypothetical protein
MHRREQGQSLVEFAVSLVVLVVMSITGEFVKEVRPGKPDPNAPLGDYRTVYLTE